MANSIEYIVFQFTLKIVVKINHNFGLELNYSPFNWINHIF